MVASIGLRSKEFLLTRNWPGVCKLRVFSRTVLLDDPRTTSQRWTFFELAAFSIISMNSLKV